MSVTAAECRGSETRDNQDLEYPAGIHHHHSIDWSTATEWGLRRFPVPAPTRPPSPSVPDTVLKDRWIKDSGPESRHYRTDPKRRSFVDKKPKSNQRHLPQVASLLFPFFSSISTRWKKHFQHPKPSIHCIHHCATHKEVQKIIFQVKRRDCDFS